MSLKPASIRLSLVAAISVLFVGCRSHQGQRMASPGPTEETVMLLQDMPHDREVILPAAATGKVCEVHGEVRTNVVLAVTYGLRAPSTPKPGYAYTQATRFPNCWWTIDGGCVEPERGGKLVTVSCCPRCREEEIKWEREQRKQ
jgi:hypothetical protein